MMSKKQNEFVNPFSESFLDTWNLWKQYKTEQHKFKYKSVITEQYAIKKLVTLSNGNEKIAEKIVIQSIESGWSGFFALKINNNAGQQTTGNISTTRESLNEIYANRFGTRP